MTGIQVNRPNISSTPSKYINPETHREDGSEHIRKPQSDSDYSSGPDMGVSMYVGGHGIPGVEPKQNEAAPEVNDALKEVAQHQSRQDAFNQGRQSGRLFGTPLESQSET